MKNKIFILLMCLLSTITFAQSTLDKDDDKDDDDHHHHHGPPTPVEFSGLTSFYNNRLYLQWSTASEYNNSGFIIRRSEDKGVTWREAGRVDGYGTTKIRHTYTWIENKEITGEVYYRLVQVDSDGKETELTLIYYDYTQSTYNGLPVNGKILYTRKIEENGQSDVIIVVTDKQVYKVLTTYKP